MKITDALRGEHASMRPFLRAVREQTNAGVSMDKPVVKCNAAALKTMIRAHASVEEPYLLEQMRGNAAAEHALQEHKEIDQLLDKAASSGSQSVLNKAVRLILGHFAEEERDVFPVAEKKMSPARLSQLGTEWAQARAIRI